MTDRLPLARFFYHEITFRPTSMEQGRHLVEAFFGGEGDTSVHEDTGRFYAPDLFTDHLTVPVK